MTSMIQHGDASQAPLPLPDFRFPAPSASAPRNSTRRPISSIELGPSSLPSFSFGSAQLASPPPSPGRSIPARPGGYHRRGASELVGGDARNGATLLSTSPTKPSTFSPPRKGHAHRRSAAISVSDLSMVLKPESVPRAESAPVSPSELENQRELFPGLLGSVAFSSKEVSQSSPEASPPMKSSNRNRVGFSDEIQFIPRPLSLVSSESSGTTIRGGHSVSNSLSSIISAPSPPKEKRSGLTTITSSVEQRPKTAGARLDFTRDPMTTPERPSPRRHRSNPLLTDLSSPQTPPTPTSARTPKKWTFFGQNEESSTQSRVASASPKEIAEPNIPTVPRPNDPIASIETPSRRPSLTRKASKKKQKKVKSWAGSILSRKSRPRSQKQTRRSPTPPNRSYGSMTETSLFDFSEPEPTTPEFQVASKMETGTDYSSWVPRRVQKQEDESSMSPIIDLDAALGPFNTPSGRDTDWDALNSGFGPTTRGKRMHSAAGMANFGGPGMHYHRRAASSPEFENPRFGIRHLSSNSTMADVFEEDEEDDAWEDSKAASDKESSHKVDDDAETGLGIGINVVDSENIDADKGMDWTLDDASKRGVKRKGSGLSEADRRHMTSSMKSANSSTSLKEEVILEETSSPVAIADDSIPPRPDSGAQSSDSTATPPFRAKFGKELAPVDIQPFSLQPPYLTPTSPNSMTQSSFPSPRSPFSYDTQRISTAPSSITDEGGFQSLLLGEPGPELRMSVDDVPSLTSSNSTMTRDSGIFPLSQTPQFRDGQRSASLSSAAISRKRSSMASLSRLISSSHGEKSKLSIESRAPSSAETDKREKTSKSKRISRLMQFWKPKDSE
jgi:hypothetical protein